MEVLDPLVFLTAINQTWTSRGPLVFGEEEDFSWIFSPLILKEGKFIKTLYP